MDILAFKFNNKFIPITDKNLISNQDGTFTYYDNKGNHHDIDENEFINCKFDIHTKQIINPNVIEVYVPFNYQINDDVVYLEDNQNAEQVTILDVKYSEPITRVAQGKRIEKSYQSLIENFNENSYYELKVYLPLFVLSNGITTDDEDLISVVYNGEKFPKNGENYAFYNTERVAYEHLDLLKAQAAKLKDDENKTNLLCMDYKI
jgi:hypothetical protein